VSFNWHSLFLSFVPSLELLFLSSFRSSQWRDNYFAIHRVLAKDNTSEIALYIVLAKDNISDIALHTVLAKDNISEIALHIALAKNNILAGMMETKYRQINPAEMFKVNAARTIVKDTPPRMHYEFSYTVELRPTNNDFVNLFARLVSTHGKRPAKSYAAMMGVST